MYNIKHQDMLSVGILILCLMDTKTIGANDVYSQKEFTIQVEPGDIACFYEKAVRNQIIDFEYQVIDGGHGDLDISFELQNPNGHPIITEYKKSDNIHRLDANVDGDYKYCFDNSFSSFNTKTVFFELIIEWDGEHGEAGGREDDWGKEVLDKTIPDEILKERLTEMQVTIMKLHDHLNSVQRTLDARRSTEARDRNQAEENNFKVSAWSSFQIIMMCIVGSIQVYMLRSLFETDPRANIWTKLKFLK
ncbi:transmembrane emp24 domain-containing protein 5-like [Contarinia nasturtii]|uniref:transmembrane emp24 domain-containing protein 5-like n=1 Tax=Contarinia nasturtii TaxID=265458 RepID=UPI0012D4AE2F|nr:transmembrane emp24 domain-containing protein 5-like [Contarinia nasturtii]